MNLSFLIPLIGEQLSSTGFQDSQDSTVKPTTTASWSPNISEVPKKMEESTHLNSYIYSVYNYNSTAYVREFPTPKNSLMR